MLNEEDYKKLVDEFYSKFPQLSVRDRETIEYFQDKMCEYLAAVLPMYRLVTTDESANICFVSLVTMIAARMTYVFSKDPCECSMRKL